MEIRWLSFLGLVLVTTMMPFQSALAQDGIQEVAVPVEEEILPNYHYEYIPDFTYDEIADRISKMETEMPFQLNDRIFSFIQYFTVRNRDYTKMVLARKDKFFPLFEETLKKHEMPIEIEFLSIIESGLDPKIRSRVGAMGLWQFMPATGRMYGMHVNSYIDDRMDPELSTEAAAKYLKSLYRMFGDWEIALSAYNCGPGNVRKAIRRSGGKTTFWEIYNYLPRETRGYVPQFQAMLYILNHLVEHNLNLEEPHYPIDYEHIRFGKAFNLERLADFTQLCLKDLEELNPSIKNKIIPESNREMSIRIPKSKSLFLKENFAMISDSLGKYNPVAILNTRQAISGLNSESKESTNGITYKVKSGDVLGVIATNHGVTISQLKEWNNLSRTLIRVGQNLVIYSGKSGNTSLTKSQSLAENSNKITPKTYTVKPGDSLWIISQKHSLSVEQIKRLNNLNSNQIKPGQQLIVG